LRRAFSCSEAPEEVVTATVSSLSPFVKAEERMDEGAEPPADDEVKTWLNMDAEPLAVLAGVVGFGG